MKKRNPPPGRPEQRFFEYTIILFIGLALVAILYPATACCSEFSAKRVACMSNMKQIGTALAMYAENNDDMASTSGPGWAGAIHPYVKNQIFGCPGEPHYKYPEDGATKVTLSYGMNANLVGLKRTYLADPTQTAMLFETTSHPIDLNHDTTSPIGRGLISDLSDPTVTYATGFMDNSIDHDLAADEGLPKSRHANRAIIEFTDHHCRVFDPKQVSAGRSAKTETDAQTEGIAAGTANQKHKATFSAF